MPISNLQQLFEHKLLDLHSAETQITEALPKMIRAASDDKLAAALKKHLEITKKQLDRLERINKEVEFQKKEMVCKGMKGIIEEGEKGLSEIDDSATKNAAIIAAAQSVEHYEMAGYGVAEEYARQLSLDEVADLLKETLQEEKQADEELSKLAKSGMFRKGINEKADK